MPKITSVKIVSDGSNNPSAKIPINANYVPIGVKVTNARYGWFAFTQQKSDGWYVVIKGTSDYNAIPSGEFECEVYYLK